MERSHFCMERGNFYYGEINFGWSKVTWSDLAMERSDQIPLTSCENFQVLATERSQT